jgi:hypothetical protein
VIAAVIKYDVLVANTGIELAEQVTARILEGWTPQGGVSVTVWQYEWEGRKGTEQETDYTYAQAMIFVEQQ